MKLKRLTIQGFKSFKDRTTVHFDQGVTGIVGPNGCGKSNIVDAIFWVMGEQSAKHLRGDSMRDLIFSGSSKYSPSSFAESTLVLENNEGKHIHIGSKVAAPSEIAITRKLYRNGETEYRINGEPCRLRDIQEVFMDTGSGAKSYSVIAQGEIEQIVQAKPEDRRRIVEEVAGITKFKMRKKESLRKIEQTGANLSHIHNLRKEVEQTLESLKEQSDKSRKAHKLKDDIKSNELIVNSHKVYNALKKYREKKTYIAKVKGDLATWGMEREQAQIDLEKKKIIRDEQTEEINQLQSVYNEKSRNFAAIEERIKGLQTSLAEKLELIDTCKDDATELEHELAKKGERLAELREERKKHYREDESGNRLIELEKILDRIKNELSEEENEIFVLSNTLRDQKEKRTQMGLDLEGTKAKILALNSNVDSTNEEIKALQERQEILSNHISSASRKLEQLKNQIASLETKESNIERDLEALKDELASLKEVVDEKFKKEIQIDSKRNSLQEFNITFAQVKSGVREILNDKEKDRLCLLGSLIKCDKEIAGGVTAMLGSIVDILVAEDGSDGGLKEWQRKNIGKGIDFAQPVDNSENSDIDAVSYLQKLGVGKVIPLRKALELPEAWKPFFRGFYLVEKLTWDVYENVSGDIPFKALSDFTGEVTVKNIYGAKTFSAGREENAQGLIERNSAIEEIEDDLALLREDMSKAKAKLEEKREQFKEKEEEDLKIKEQLSKLRSELTLLEGVSLVASREKAEEVAKQIEVLKSKKDATSDEKSTQDKSAQELQEKLSEAEKSFAQVEKELKQRQSKREDIKVVYQSERDKLLTLRVESKSIGTGLSVVGNQIVDLEAEIERGKLKAISSRERIKSLNNDIAEVKSQLKELQESSHSMVRKLQADEKSLSFTKESIDNVVDQIAGGEGILKELEKNINEGEKEVLNFSNKINRYIEDEEQITRDTFEKYFVDLRKIVGAYLEYSKNDYQDLVDLHEIYLRESEGGIERIKSEPYDFEPLEPKEVKKCEGAYTYARRALNNLGEINWQAVDDYERQKHRYEFLAEQEKELEKSLSDLTEAIEHIDEKSKTRFAFAFEEVRTRFEKVFPLVFGGGNARLEIKGEIDDPECGIEIIAQPPGKKMQNLNLMSGGEKALTAVVLIFSIFLVKPAPFCLLDEVDAPLDDANVGRFNDILRSMSDNSQFILITHNKKTMELNDTLYGVTMQEPGVSKAVSVHLQ